MQKWNFINVYGGQSSLINIDKESKNNIIAPNDGLPSITDVIKNLAQLQQPGTTVSIEDLKMLVINSEVDVLFIPNDKTEDNKLQYFSWQDVETLFIENLAEEIINY